MLMAKDLILAYAKGLSMHTCGPIIQYAYYIFSALFTALNNNNKKDTQMPPEVISDFPYFKIFLGETPQTPQISSVMHSTNHP